tara:strand:+ start:2228 stop:2371 length:144 start_codon:yes stop_codon:yes gene_type:complete
MDWLLHGFLEQEIDSAAIGQMGLFVNGWTTAAGVAVTSTFKPILIIF